MKFSRLLFFPLAACLLPLSSCAKSPSGGPVNQVPNRMQVTLTIKGGLSPRGYYAVAFDDDPTRQGPVAITGASNTANLNKVVGGTYRFLVLYNNNRFTVYRRPNPAVETGEVVELARTPFVGNITPRATTNSINFTLDLDARASDNSYYFAHDNNGQLTATQVSVNAIATTRPFTNPQDQRIKPVDALGFNTTSTPERVQIAGTRSANINDDFGTANDLNNYDPSFSSPNTNPDFVLPAQLDIQTLNLNIVRG